MRANYLAKYGFHLATSTNFMSLLVWNSDSPDTTYNPGNQDELVGDGIVDAIAAARDAQPPDSEAWGRMNMNFEFFEEATYRMLYHDGPNWWEGGVQGHHAQSGVLNLAAPASNRTDTASNQLVACLSRARNNQSLRQACMRQQWLLRLNRGNARSSGGRVTS